MSIAYETVPDRCRDCGKQLVVDIGAGYFGEHQVLMVCLHCGVPPEQTDWVVGLRDAVRTVLARQGGQ